MIQIVKELIRCDYGKYWQEVGVNKRLKVYKVLSMVAEFLMLVITIFIAMLTLKLLLHSLVGLIDGTSGIYGYYTAYKLKYSVVNIFFHRLMPLYWSVFLIIVIIKCIKNTNSIFLTVSQKLMKWISNTPFAMIGLFLILCLCINEFDYAYYSVVTILILIMVKKVLNAFVNRVNMMEQYALGFRNLRGTEEKQRK